MYIPNMEERIREVILLLKLCESIQAWSFWGWEDSNHT